MGVEPSPYQIAVSRQTLDRIEERIKSVRMPATSSGAGWKYGLDDDWFKELVAYWTDDFAWARAQQELNRTPQYTLRIKDAPIHFAWIKPKKKSAPLPFILLHGWPYTFATMLPLADRLAEAGFEVIVPSLPGYGFSPAPNKEVRGLRFIGSRIAVLMEVLGFDRYIVHGGDHGAVIADWLAIDVPDRVAGIHANTIGFRHHGAEFGNGQTGIADATEEEKAYVKSEVEHMDSESAYFRLQATRPETITYALADSPVGWAAYMLDKWQKWTAGGPEAFVKAYSRDHLLTEVMIYLVTDTVATGIWPYAGFALEPFGLEPGQTLDQPFGYSPFDDPLLPRIPPVRRTIEAAHQALAGAHGRRPFPDAHGDKHACKGCDRFRRPTRDVTMKRIDRSLDVGLLITAVRRDDPTAAASALDAGADPDTCAEGYPLLCLAAASGHRKVLELLLRAGASPHLLDAHMGASALHKAAQSGVVDIAKALLAHGAFIDLQAPTHGHTPLIDAVLHRRPAMVDFLMEAGANVFISARGMLAPIYTALDLARIRGDRDIIDRLEERERMMRQTAVPALHVAIGSGDDRSVMRLLDAGANPNEPARVIGARDDGQTPMHIAARDGRGNVAALLADRGARADVFDHFMRATPGHKAAALGHPDVLRIMVERDTGIDLEAQGPYNGYTALHDAVWWGHAEAVRTLLALGASRDARGLDGRTPLDIAVQDGQADCLAVLLDNQL